MYSYSVIQWLLFFYTYCFFGWCFESAYVSAKEGRLVNRGFLRSPFLPIYGSGAMCILIVCLPFKGNILAVYLLGVIFPTLLEYVTGAVMERLFKMKYWDYSHKKCNLHGYICLDSSLAWGVLSVVLINYIHPPIEHLVMHAPHVLNLILAVIFSIQFVSDFIISFQAAFSLSHVLQELERIRVQMEETRVQMELARAEAKDYFEETRLGKRAEVLRQELNRRIPSPSRRFLYRSILRAHPTADSAQFAAALAFMRDLALRRRKPEDSTKTTDHSISH